MFLVYITDDGSFCFAFGVHIAGDRPTPKHFFSVSSLIISSSVCAGGRRVPSNTRDNTFSRTTEPHHRWRGGMELGCSLGFKNRTYNEKEGARTANNGQVDKCRKLSQKGGILGAWVSLMFPRFSSFGKVLSDQR